MQLTIGVLAVQGDVREHVRALESADATTVLVRHSNELEQLDGIVLPGGESTTMDKLLRACELQQGLKDCLANGLPAYGACAGMILLADRVLDATHDQQTLGGFDITVRRNAFGRQGDSFEEDLWMPVIRNGENQPIRAVFIRAPWVEEGNQSVEVLATVSTGVTADRIVAIRDRTLLATSFHPEITGDGRVHEYFVDMIRNVSR